VSEQQVTKPPQCVFRCDGCGKTAPGVHYPGGWFKPDVWFERSDADGVQLACSRECIATVSKASGKTSLVIPL